MNRIDFYRANIYKAIDTERDRQSEMWSKPHSWGQGDASSPDVAPMTKVAVLTEELGEVARAALELDNNQLQVELVQLAAVAVAWLEAM
jgi:NTP pyrophosphatase (non-canonical NTP hydrolase)